MGCRFCNAYNIEAGVSICKEGGEAIGGFEANFRRNCIDLVTIKK